MGGVLKQLAEAFQPLLQLDLEFLDPGLPFGRQQRREAVYLLPVYGAL